MALFEVVGSDPTVENVDILGVIRAPGEKVELLPEDAIPLVEMGLLVELESPDTEATPVATDEVVTGEVAVSDAVEAEEGDTGSVVEAEVETVEVTE